MKKLLFLFLIIPLFFACKQNTASGTPVPVPACSSDSDCASRTDGMTMCRNGECVDPSPRYERACAVDGITVIDGFGDEQYVCGSDMHCSNGECVTNYIPECTRDEHCSSGFHCADNGRCVSD